MVNVETVKLKCKCATSLSSEAAQGGLTQETG